MGCERLSLRLNRLEDWDAVQVLVSLEFNRTCAKTLPLASRMQA